MFSRLLVLSLSSASAITLAPVTFDQNRPAFCEGITCAPVECPKAFTWESSQDKGTCCPVCTNAELQEKALPKKEQPTPFEGHVGLHAEAHELCKPSQVEATDADGNVVSVLKVKQEASCPSLDFCAEKEFIPGRCCESCKKAVRNIEGMSGKYEREEFLQADKDRLAAQGIHV